MEYILNIKDRVVLNLIYDMDTCCDKIIAREPCDSEQYNLAQEFKAKSDWLDRDYEDYDFFYKKLETEFLNRLSKIYLNE